MTAAERKTSTPVDFPLSFDGPVSALGTGRLAFAGTTTIPSLTGRENDFIGAFVGPFLPAPNNIFTSTVSPPAPVTAWGDAGTGRDRPLGPARPRVRWAAGRAPAGRAAAEGPGGGRRWPRRWRR